MAELRFNPVLRDWVMVASHRQKRPNMPKDFCPFCPGSGKVPEQYDVHCYDNDFPALSPNPPEPDAFESPLFETAPLHGKCEVILYSPNHTATLPDLPQWQVRKLVDLWTERFEALSKDPKVRYVLIFENRGELVGVTMPHPHGQIYAYPWLPKKLQEECTSASEYQAEHGSCLFCDLVQAEREDGRRIIFENEHFTVYLPFYSEYPYGVQIMAKRHVQNLAQLTDAEKDCLADTLRKTSGLLDSLFDKTMPYMMCLHQAPVNCEDDPNYYHFHIEFYPPLRSATQIKWNASSETGAWAHCNPTAPEEKAVELREAYERFLKKEESK